MFMIYIYITSRLEFATVFISWRLFNAENFIVFWKITWTTDNTQQDNKLIHFQSYFHFFHDRACDDQLILELKITMIIYFSFLSFSFFSNGWIACLFVVESWWIVILQFFWCTILRRVVFFFIFSFLFWLLFSLIITCIELQRFITIVYLKNHPMCCNSLCFISAHQMSWDEMRCESRGEGEKRSLFKRSITLLLSLTFVPLHGLVHWHLNFVAGFAS